MNIFMIKIKLGLGLGLRCLQKPVVRLFIMAFTLSTTKHFREPFFWISESCSKSDADTHPHQQF